MKRQTDRRQTVSESALTLHRLKTVESDIAEIKQIVHRIEATLSAFIKLEAEQRHNTAAIERAFIKIESHETVLNGRDGKPGIQANLESTREIVQSHRWALRTVAGAIIMQIAAIIYTLLHKGA